MRCLITHIFYKLKQSYDCYFRLSYQKMIERNMESQIFDICIDYKLINCNFMQKQEKKPFIHRVSSFFKMLCSGKEQVTNRQKSFERRSTIKKKPRITFILDRAIVKISRKNIILEEFMANTILSSQLEKYIVSRLSSESIILFFGQFTQFTLNYVPFGLKLIEMNNLSVKTKNSDFLTVQSYKNIKFKKNMFDALIFQLYYGSQKQNSIGAQIDEIQTVLYNFHGDISNFLFICSNSINTQSFHQLFVHFKDLYMFEVQRIMVMEKCHCILIYISTRPNFIRVDDLALSQFLVQQFIKKDEEIIKDQFKRMLLKLFKEQLYVQTCNTIGQMMISSKISKKYNQNFLNLMYQRYDYSHHILQEFIESEKQKQRNLNAFGGLSLFNQTFHNDTPIFAQQQLAQISNTSTEYLKPNKKNQALISFAKPSDKTSQFQGSQCGDFSIKSYKQVIK